MWTRLGCTAAVLGVSACQSGASDMGANDPGTGTGTLELDARVLATPRWPNTHARDAFDVTFAVRVARGAEAVTAGEVTITSATGKTPLTYRAEAQCWTGSSVGYDETYTLDVVSGNDTVTAVRVEGPDIHVFSSPIEDAAIDPTAPLRIVWQRGAAAQQAVLRGTGLDALGIEDSGDYRLPAGLFRADKAEPRRHMLELIRTNLVVPRGGAGDSAWRVSIDNVVDFVAQPEAIPL